MSILTLQHHQTITHWPRVGLDSAGDLEFGAPSEILGKWENVGVLFIANTGEERRSRSVVYLGDDISEGDYLMLGTLAINDEQDPLKNHRAFPVLSFSKIPDFTGTDFERVAYL